MFGLLYPAVLGSFFFLLLPVLFGARSETSERVQVGLGKTVSGCLVVYHFIVDFHLTSSLPAERYSSGGFIMDLLILVALFRAFDALNISRPAEPLDLRSAAVAMAFIYALFVTWTFFVLEDVAGRQLVLAVDAIGFILFIVVAVRRSVFLFCGSLLIVSTTMAVIGSPVVGSLRSKPGGLAASDAAKAPAAALAPNPTPVDQKAPLPGSIVPSADEIYLRKAGEEGKRSIVALRKELFDPSLNEEQRNIIWRTKWKGTQIMVPQCSLETIARNYLNCTISLSSYEGSRLAASFARPLSDEMFVRHRKGMNCKVRGRILDIPETFHCEGFPLPGEVESTPCLNLQLDQAALDCEASLAS
ncbi:MAG TPA: hypothetical protein VMW27_16620 [Thermoanaerobaculia bacterium]|nr:hypothetical protein [Thermoanaerobaculia bacterium]